ncbi:MAG: hypothetical protein EHM47_15275, partial [Ignavibacteriales bacterium]
VQLMLASLVYSQSVLNEAFLDQLGNSNSALVEQLGIDLLNKIIINQVEAGNDGGILRFQNGVFTGNAAQIIQTGNRNTAVVKQTGDNNSSTVVQYGDANLYDLELSGNDNTTEIVQFGNENSVLQRLSGDELNYVISQAGSGNEFIHVESGMDGRQMRISQSGGMRLIIR